VRSGERRGYFGASEATICSKRGSLRSVSHSECSRSQPWLVIPSKVLSFRPKWRNLSILTPVNRLYFGDNLKWLSDRKEFPHASVDLVYLDPPFNSNADYNVLHREPTEQVS
jgi:16S rRNA G966 N2-methylase RsmD